MAVYDRLIPDLICDRVENIPFDRFFSLGVKTVVFDIDNTLVSYETPEPDEKLISFLKSFSEKGISVALVSNNSPERVELFNRKLSLFAVPDAHKPLSRALAPVFKEFGVSPKEVLLVGDQLLTDVLCAKGWGTFAAVVSPIKKRENLFFRFKRVLEKPFVRIYYRRERKQK